MSKIKLITTNKYGKKDNEFLVGCSNSAFAFLSKGNYIEIDGVEYYINSIKTKLKDGRIVDIEAKLTLDGTSF